MTYVVIVDIVFHHSLHFCHLIHRMHYVLLFGICSRMCIYFCLTLLFCNSLIFLKDAIVNCDILHETVGIIHHQPSGAHFSEFEQSRWNVDIDSYLFFSSDTRWLWGSIFYVFIFNFYKAIMTKSVFVVKLLNFIAFN